MEGLDAEEEARENGATSQGRRVGGGRHVKLHGRKDSNRGTEGGEWISWGRGRKEVSLHDDKGEEAFTVSEGAIKKKGSRKGR